VLKVPTNLVPVDKKSDQKTTSELVEQVLTSIPNSKLYLRLFFFLPPVTAGHKVLCPPGHICPALSSKVTKVKEREGEK